MQAVQCGRQETEAVKHKKSRARGPAFRVVA